MYGQLDKKVEDLEGRIIKVEERVTKLEEAVLRPSQKIKNRLNKNSDLGNCSKAIESLWKEKVFSQPKTIGEVKKELTARGYNFSDPTTAMALKFAVYLTRKGKRREFSYVQKYPYSIENKKVD